jgi:hypothetical protein
VIARDLKSEKLLPRINADERGSEEQEKTKTYHGDTEARRKPENLTAD